MLGMRNGAAAVAPKHFDQWSTSEGWELAQKGHRDRATLTAGGVVCARDGKYRKHHSATVRPEISTSNEDRDGKTTIN